VSEKAKRYSLVILTPYSSRKPHCGKKLILALTVFLVFNTLFKFTRLEQKGSLYLLNFSTEERKRIITRKRGIVWEYNPKTSKLNWVENRSNLEEISKLS
jgi:hypothetical protein